MSWLWEDSTLVLCLAGVAEGVLATLMWRTGRLALAGGMLLVLVLAIGCVVAERLVETKAEEVEVVLTDLARMLETNDVEQVVTLFDPEATELESRARWAMSMATIKEAKFNGLSVTINQLTQPPTATADFVGRIRIQGRNAPIAFETYIRRLVLTLEHDGTRWLVTDYEVGDPRGGATSHEAY